MTEEARTSKGKPSRFWYLLPIFLAFAGGVIAYFILKDRDRKFAKRVLITGVVITIVYTLLSILLNAYF